MGAVAGSGCVAPGSTSVQLVRHSYLQIARWVATDALLGVPKNVRCWHAAALASLGAERQTFSNSMPQQQRHKSGNSSNSTAGKNWPTAHRIKCGQYGRRLRCNSSRSHQSIMQQARLTGWCLLVTVAVRGTPLGLRPQPRDECR